MNNLGINKAQLKLIKGNKIKIIGHKYYIHFFITFMIMPVAYEQFRTP